jgi:PEP-CTERM motif-containing protein
MNRLGRILTGAAIASLAAAAAQAAPIITNVSGDVTPAGFTVIDTFDAAAALGYTATLSNASDLRTVGASDAAQPPSDPTDFIALETGDSFTLHSDAGFTAFSFYMGSPDSYNFLTVLGVTYGGSALMGTPLVAADGNQGVGRTVTYMLGQVTHDVTWSSTGVAFEFDDIAVAGVPEPASWALMIGGLGLAGAMLRRRRGLALA